MKVLIINTYHYLRGGDCRHALGIADLLRSNKHDIHFFSMHSKENMLCSDDKYFVSEIDFRKAITKKNPFVFFNIVRRSIYSREARKKITNLLDEIKPDIAHLHSIRHHLTKSILPELAKRKIPVVWTLHDYKELCPNTMFYDGNQICEACKERKYFNVITKRCKKGSLPASIITWLESSINDLLNYNKHIDLFISPSQFLRNKFIEYGYQPRKVISLPNFLAIDNFQPNYRHDNYLLYLGRLEKEKGIFTLLEGFKKVSSELPNLKLKIAGTGSIQNELAQQIAKQKFDNVELLGFKKGKELEDLTRDALGIVIPSECYENYPFSCLEAMAYGKPVIATRIGGIPEQVEDGETGFLFKPFNAGELAEKIQLLASMSEEEVEVIGRKARKKIEETNSPDVYLNKIENIYSNLLKKNKQSQN